MRAKTQVLPRWSRQLVCLYTKNEIEFFFVLVYQGEHTYDEFKTAAIGLHWTGWFGYLLCFFHLPLLTFHYPLILMPIKHYAIIHHMNIFDSFNNTG